MVVSSYPDDIIQVIWVTAVVSYLWQHRSASHLNNNHLDSGRASAPCTVWEWGTELRPRAHPRWWTSAWPSSCVSPGRGPLFGCGWSCTACPSCWGWVGWALQPVPRQPSRRGGRCTAGKRQPGCGSNLAGKKKKNLTSSVHQKDSRHQTGTRRRKRRSQRVTGNFAAVPVRTPVSGQLHPPQQFWCKKWHPPWGEDVRQQAAENNKTLCCRWSRASKSERGLRYECLQPKPAWCLKQLKTDVEPMIIFWVGLGSCTFVVLMYGGTLST